MMITFLIASDRGVACLDAERQNLKDWRHTKQDAARTTQRMSRSSAVDCIISHLLTSESTLVASGDYRVGPFG